MADFMIVLEGTPDEIEAMLAVGSRIDGAVAYKKKKINPGCFHVWYRGKRDAPHDLVAAIKRKSGVTKPKAIRAKKAKAVKAEWIEEADDDE